MKTVKKTVVWLVVALLALTFAGCGKKEADKPTKEFASPDATMSVMLAEDWQTEGEATDGMIGAYSKNGNDGVVILQLIKGVDASSLQDVKDVVESTYKVSGKETMDGAGVAPGLENVEAYKCKIDLEGESADGYFIYGESGYAYYAMLYAAEKMNDDTMVYANQVFSCFKEDAPEIPNNSTVEVTDTILWMNGTHAVLTSLNGWDYTVFGSMPANDDSMALQQSMLNEWWEVTDRATADETIDWLMSEGHRMDFAEMMDMLTEDGLGEMPEGERADYLLNNYTNMTEEIAQQYADFYALYDEKGIDMMSAWDYSRAMSVLSNAYIAGYYTETEALDKSLEIATVIQTVFDSWDAFEDSYMVGYEYWAEESSDERRAVYEELKAAPNSPYSLDWNMTLEKSW